MKIKENIEAGMYFKFKKTFRSYTDDVYNIVQASCYIYNTILLTLSLS